MGPSKNEKFNVVLTGGHAASTAMSVIQEINTRNLGWQVYFLGSRWAIEGKKVTTLEYELLPKLGVKFVAISAGRLQRKLTFYTVPSILKIPSGFLQALFNLIKIRPKIVLSFGGFASFPVVVSAKILGIPVVLHEQTSAAGRANLMSSKIAAVIALSRQQSIRFFPKEKCVLTGNPIVEEVLKVPVKKKLSKPPVLFVAGGSRGSQSINSVFEVILPKILESYRVIHQTGDLDFKYFKNLKTLLPGNLRKKYDLFSRVDPVQMADMYRQADIMVSRAGANTVSEAMVMKLPSIFIPLPISFMDEQAKNAEVACTWGMARMIFQKDLTPKALLKKINEIKDGYASIVKSAEKYVSPDIGASARLVDLLVERCK